MSKAAAGVGAAAIILVYFLALAAPGFSAYFNPDDAMNLYAWWVRPLSALIKANLLYFLPDIRPLGGAYYLMLFSVFGLNAPAFAAVRFALLVLNLWIVYLVVGRVTGSRETAALAVLLFAYHGALADMYASNGTIYDVLCFTLYYSALLVYMRSRRALAVVAVLLIAALNAKEMAVTLPAVLLVWDILQRRARPWLGAVVTGTVVAPFVIGHFAVSGPLTGQPAYTPVFAASRMLETALSYVNQAFYAWPGGGDAVAGWFTPLRLALFLAATYAAARLFRSKAMEFGWWLAAIGAAPLLITTPRPGYVLYVPLLGAALYGSVLLVEVRNRAAGKLELPVRAAFFIGLTLTLASTHMELRHRVVSQGPGGVYHMRSMAAALPDSVPKGSRILLVNMPLDESTWQQFFRLTYRDNSLVVDSRPRPASPNAYDYAFEWRGNAAILIQPDRQP